MKSCRRFLVYAMVLLSGAWAVSTPSAFALGLQDLEESDRTSETTKEPSPGESGQADGADTNDQDTNEDSFHLGGALRFNAFYKSWLGEEANRDRGGDFAFDTARVNVDGSHQGLGVSLEYRFYSGYNMLHHGYFGYTFANGSEVQFGVHRNPLGLLPYASHNWFFDLTYYLGMEDDYDAGVKLIVPLDALNVQVAFYKNDEGSYTGDSLDSARYSYDVVRASGSELGDAGMSGPRTNEETNQVNARVAYTIDHGQTGSSEVGLSGEYGGLYNATTARMGKHWATAVHANLTYGRVNIMLEALKYAFRPENPLGQDDRFIVLGAYDAPYKVAAEGSMMIANVAYKLPIQQKPIDSFTFYNNYSFLAKSEDSFADSLYVFSESGTFRLSS
jgi:hypothetical protein